MQTLKANGVPSMERGGDVTPFSHRFMLSAGEDFGNTKVAAGKLLEITVLRLNLTARSSGEKLRRLPAFSASLSDRAGPAVEDRSERSLNEQRRGYGRCSLGFSATMPIRIGARTVSGSTRCPTESPRRLDRSLFRPTDRPNRVGVDVGVGQINCTCFPQLQSKGM